MTIKKILVPFNDPQVGAGALTVAFALARDHGAHVEVLHVKPDPRMAAVAYMGEPVSASMVEKMMRDVEKRSASDTAKVRKIFDDLCAKTKTPVTTRPGGGKASASFRTETGVEDESIRIAGRVADLVLMARPQGQLATSQRLVLEAALIDTGRPLMVVPPKAPAKIGSNVAIAWNGSVQAAHAVEAAMGFIEGAKSVTILSANENGTDYRPGDLADYLAWHGVKAKAVQVTARTDAGKALVSAAAKAGADLLVMGAYGHSRMRELVLGGVTKYVLQETTITTLLAH